MNANRMIAIEKKIGRPTSFVEASTRLPNGPPVTWVNASSLQGAKRIFRDHNARVYKYPNSNGDPRQ